MVVLKYAIYAEWDQNAILCLLLGLVNINGDACMCSFAAIITVAFELYNS
jgi:hypothetical protein